MDDAELARLAQQGRTDAFAELVARYQSRLLCFLGFFCRDHHSLEDAAQEAFLQAYLHIDQFDPSRKFKSWLYTIARRLLQKRKASVSLEVDEAKRLVSRDHAPQQPLEAEEQRVGLWRRIRAATNDDEFQMLWWVYAEQLPLIEFAEAAGASYDACKQRLSRLRRRLRECLSEEDFLENYDGFYAVRRAG